MNILGYIPDSEPLSAFSGIQGLGCGPAPAVANLLGIGSGSLDRTKKFFARDYVARPMFGRGSPLMEGLRGLAGLGNEPTCPPNSCVNDAVTLFLDWPPKTVSRRITSGQAIDQYNSSGLGPSTAIKGVWIPAGLRAVVLWIAFSPKGDKYGYVRLDVLYGPGIYNLTPPKGQVAGFVGEGVLERLTIDWENGRLENLPATGDALYSSEASGFTPPAPPFIANLKVFGTPVAAGPLPSDAAPMSTAASIVAAAAGATPSEIDRIRASERAKCTLRRGVLLGREKIKGLKLNSGRMKDILAQLVGGQKRIIRILNPLSARQGEIPAARGWSADAGMGERRGERRRENSDGDGGFTKKLSAVRGDALKRISSAHGNTLRNLNDIRKSIRTIALKLRDHIKDTQHATAQQRMLRLLDAGSASRGTAERQAKLSALFSGLLKRARGGMGHRVQPEGMDENPAFFTRITPTLTTRTILNA